MRVGKCTVNRKRGIECPTSALSITHRSPLCFLLRAGFAASQLLVTQLIGPRKRTATKLMPYECGKDPVGSARDRYSIKFYSVAVIFLLFDIEVLFMVPFAVAFKYLLAAEKISGTLSVPCSDRDHCLYDNARGRIHIRLEKRHLRLGTAGTGRSPGTDQSYGSETRIASAN